MGEKTVIKLIERNQGFKGFNQSEELEFPIAY